MVIFFNVPAWGWNLDDGYQSGPGKSGDWACYIVMLVDTGAFVTREMPSGGVGQALPLTQSAKSTAGQEQGCKSIRGRGGGGRLWGTFKKLPHNQWLLGSETCTQPMVVMVAFTGLYLVGCFISFSGTSRLDTSRSGGVSSSHGGQGRGVKYLAKTDTR